MEDFVRVPKSDWTDICDAVRGKTGGLAGLLSGQIPGEIEGIQTGGGGGSEFFGMLNDMWAYGTFRTTENIAAESIPFYISIPSRCDCVILYKDSPNTGVNPGRPVYFGCLAIAHEGYAGQHHYAAPGFAETDGNTYYDISYTAYGKSNGQTVKYAKFPRASVGVGGDGYDMTVLLFRPKAGNNTLAPEYYADKIHLTSLKANTWTTIPGTDKKVYFGFVAPELDA